MSERWSAIAVVGLILLSGCSWSVLGTNANAPALSEVEYPSGASASGIDTPETIIDTTGKNSEQTDYTATFNRTIVHPDGSTQSTRIQKRASLESQSAMWEMTIRSESSPTITSDRFVSGGDESFSIYVKNKRQGNDANLTKRGPFNVGYQAGGHSVLAKPKVVDWILYQGALGMENLTATGTTTVDDEPAIVYELAEPRGPDTIGIKTIRIVVGVNGTLYRMDLKSQSPSGNGEMKVKHLHYSFDPGEVLVKKPGWVEKAE